VAQGDTGRPDRPQGLVEERGVAVDGVEAGDADHGRTSGGGEAGCTRRDRGGKIESIGRGDMVSYHRSLETTFGSVLELSPSL
jgi:hypothetical protein